MGVCAAWAEEAPSGTAHEPASAQRLEVCAILPLSGPYEGIGRRALRTLASVLEGGDIVIRPLDSQELGPATQVARARDAGCSLAIGGLGDRESMAMAEAAEAAAMPLLDLGAEPDDRPSRHVIWVRTPRADLVAAIARHALGDAGRRLGHVLVPDTAFGRRVAAHFRKAFEAGGGRVATERAVPIGEDPARIAALFAAVRSEALQGRPCEGEVLFLGFGIEWTLRLVPRLEFEGVPARRGEGGCLPLLLVGTSLWNDPLRVSRLGDDLDGARFADVALPEGERDVLDAEVRDAAFLARALMLRQRSVPTEGGTAGEPTQESLVRRSEGLAFRGATGDLVVRGGRVIGRVVRVFEVRHGEIRPSCEGACEERPP